MKGGVILAAIAAFAYYKYSKLTADQKRDMVNNLKEKGQKLYDQYIPENVKNKIPGKIQCKKEIIFYTQIKKQDKPASVRAAS